MTEQTSILRKNIDLETQLEEYINKNLMQLKKKESKKSLKDSPIITHKQKAVSTAKELKAEPS